MLSEQRAREILNDKTLSDEEVLKIRDYFHGLAEVIFDQWQETKKKKLPNQQEKNIN